MPIYREGATNLDSANAFQRDPMRYHLRAFEKLGSVYRTWFRDRMWVVLAGVEANEFIWKNGKLWSYSTSNAPFLAEMGPDHVTALDGDHHKEKRAILKPAFDHAPAMRFLPMYNTWFRRELQVSADAGKPVELVKYWSEIITKVNSKTVAQANIPDEVIPLLAKWEYQMLRGLFLDAARASYIVREEYLTLKSTAMGWLGKIVDERLANPDAYNDNFAATMRARQELEGADLSRDNLINDLYLILLAGTDNTSSLINWALIFTWYTPGWLEELREELDGWDGEDVMALSRLTKLKATILETQRVRPGGFTLSKHAAVDFEFDGYHIPAGTDILYPHAIGHFLESYYPDPFTFNPNRFVESGRFVPKTFGFFGGGTHICLGRNHSTLQSPLALAQVVKNYDLIFEKTPEFEVRVGYAGTRLDDELWVRLAPRKV